MINLIIGLGNSGAEYEKTRHNIGFEILDRFCQLQDEEISYDISNKLFDIARLKFEDRSLLLAKPKTFMNLSGVAVAQLLGKYELEKCNILAVLDDFNIPLGTQRFRENGSDGGHNGLFSIINELESDDFKRLRIGIGPLSEEISETEFVLSKFDEIEEKTVEKSIINAVDSLHYCLSHSFDEAMSKYNKKPA